MAIEIQVQNSQPLPKQQEVKKQDSQSGNPVNVVSGVGDLKTPSAEKEGASSTDELSQSQLSEVQNKVSQLNDHLQNLNRNLQFTVDERSGSSVVTIRDTETEEVIRQFPSEEILDARSALEQVKGLLIETKA